MTDWMNEVEAFWEKATPVLENLLSEARELKTGADDERTRKLHNKATEELWGAVYTGRDIPKSLKTR